ncbi:MAG: hypothetical protein QG608_3475 [Actinomycetota bacterium]|nr:hypothetical protein [Actinomycetota bacterium]
MAKVSTPRIADLRVQNFRVLRDVQLPELTPFTVVVGPNGSGKSTLFDVFAFLADSLSVGLRKAWEQRGRFRELRSRGAEGPIRFEITYINPERRKLRYVLAIEETGRGPVVAEEKLLFTRGSQGRPFTFLDFSHGEGVAFAGQTPDRGAERQQQTLSGPDLLAVSALGQLANHPRVAEFRSFAIGWYLSHVSAASTRGVPEAGPQERLSRSGDNLPNVVQYLSEQHPDRWSEIMRRLAARVPRLSEVTSRVLEDGRLLLRFRDSPFEEPVQARFASDGTLKLLAYLTVLHDPELPPLIGIEEPENQLHPYLMRGLVEECRDAAAAGQVLLSTHSPQLLNAAEGPEVRVINRGQDGYARITTATGIPGVPEHLTVGAVLGDLWMEGYLTPGWATEPERW